MQITAQDLVGLLTSVQAVVASRSDQMMRKSLYCRTCKTVCHLCSFASIQQELEQ